MKFATVLRTHQEVNKLAKAAFITASPVDVPAGFEIPCHFDGRVIWKHLLGPIMNQGECGACYAYATNSVLGDKYAIHTLGQVRPVLNPLETAMCALMGTTQQFRDDVHSIQMHDPLWMSTRTMDVGLSACRGNSIYVMGMNLFASGGVETTCVSYTMLKLYSTKWGNLPKCTDVEGSEADMCCQSLSDTVCAPEVIRRSQRIWPAKSYYMVSSDDASLDEMERSLMLNIMRWGPVVMSFVVFERFLNDFDGQTVFQPTSADVPVHGGDIGHSVKVVGWGQEEDTRYWICANSWGAGWGMEGYFYIERKNPLLQMESNHLSLWPLIPRPGADVPFTVAEQLMSEEEVRLRDSRKVDPVTFHLVKNIPLIQSGQLLGSLEPVIDGSIVPAEAGFWAFLIGSVQFPTPSGHVVGPLYRKAVVEEAIKYLGRRTNSYAQARLLVGSRSDSGYIALAVALLTALMVSFVTIVVLLLQHWIAPE
jgi:cathepsin B